MSPVTPWAWPLAVLYVGDPPLPQQPVSILWEPPVICLSEPSAGHSRGTSPPLLRAIPGLLVSPKQRPGRTWGGLSLGQLWPLGLRWEKHLRMPLEGGLSSHLQNLFPPPQKSHALSIQSFSAITDGTGSMPFALLHFSLGEGSIRSSLLILTFLIIARPPAFF